MRQKTLTLTIGLVLVLVGAAGAADIGFYEWSTPQNGYIDSGTSFTTSGPFTSIDAIATGTSTSINNFWGANASGGIDQYVWNGTTYASTYHSVDTTTVFTSVSKNPTSAVTQGNNYYAAKAGGGAGYYGWSTPANGFVEDTARPVDGSVVFTSLRAVSANHFYAANPTGGVDMYEWNAGAGKYVSAYLSADRTTVFTGLSVMPSDANYYLAAKAGGGAALYGYDSGTNKFEEVTSRPIDSSAVFTSVFMIDIDEDTDGYEDYFFAANASGGVDTYHWDSVAGKYVSTYLSVDRTTVFGDVSGDPDGLADEYFASTIPEPTTMGLLAMGAVGVLLRKRRK